MFLLIFYRQPTHPAKGLPLPITTRINLFPIRPIFVDSNVATQVKVNLFLRSISKIDDYKMVSCQWNVITKRKKGTQTIKWFITATRTLILILFNSLIFNTLYDKHDTLDCLYVYHESSLHYYNVILTLLLFFATHKYTQFDVLLVKAYTHSQT